MRAARHEAIRVAIWRQTPGLWRLALRQALPLAIVAIFLFLLRDRIAQVDAEAVVTALGRVTAGQWLGALLATAVSFWAVGHYDAVLHRHLATEVPCARANRAGIAAIAISQTLGLGLVTGSLVRWRMLPGVSLWQATRITAAVALSFLMGWAVVTSLVLVALPLPGAEMAWVGAMTVLAAAGCLVAMSLLAPPLSLRGRMVAWPSLITLIRIPVFAAIDTGAAALALWVLLPDAATPGFTVMLPAFLLALGAGLVSNTPGGIGAFEVTLLALLPGVGIEPLLAAVIAYRAVYYGLPAALGAVAMAIGPRAHEVATEASAICSAAALAAPPITRLVDRAPRAEVQLLRQGEHRVLVSAGAQAGWMLGTTRQALVAFLDPFGRPGTAADLIALLGSEAQRRGRLACLYKVGGRTAAQARRAGWVAMGVAREAWISPVSFDLNVPERAGLRRKLRKAERAGITISRALTPLPSFDLAAISAEWAASRGGERGFSMGRYAPDYVAGQAVWLARQGDRIVGFATFHVGAEEWTLDLMRQTADAPDGTMNALLVAAIDAARTAGLPRLSLAALPPEQAPLGGLAAALLAHVGIAEGVAGLAQFKLGFAPNWQPLYIVAPTRAALVVAAIDIARQIADPGPLPGPGIQPSDRARPC